MLHFDLHLKLINTSASHQNTLLDKNAIFFHITSSFLGVGMVKKYEGNVNLHSTVPLFIWSFTLFSKYSRTPLTSLLRISQLRIVGDIAFWNKTPRLIFIDPIFEWCTFLDYSNPTELCSEICKIIKRFSSISMHYNISRTVNFCSLLAVLLKKIEICWHWVFCRKFNSPQLLFESFYEKNVDFFFFFQIYWYFKFSNTT